MKIKIYLSWLMLGLFSACSVAATQPLKLDWMELIPQSERNQFNEQGMPMVSHESSEQAKQNKIGSVRHELNGSRVKIPGFVIPLEGDENIVTEYFLVPYFGACIHVPPPPPNQIIYVKMPQGAPVQHLWDIIYVVGTLEVKEMSNDIAQAGYTIIADSIEPYDDQ